MAMQANAESLGVGHPVRNVTDGEALADASRRCATREVVALDTEFERSQTYFAIPALVQTFDGETIALIDPLAIEALTPLVELLLAPEPLKVIHSAGEDIELLARLANTVPEAVYDTQIAAGLAGLGAAVSYRDLVAQVCGVALEKSQTRSDWLRRPLSKAQRRYAALDVAYLLEIHGWLADRIAALGREAWVAEDTARLLAAAAAGPDLDRMYREFKLAWKLPPEARSALRGLLAWREAHAAKRDQPRRRVLDDDALLNLAQRRPREAGEIIAVAGLGRRKAAELAPRIARVLREAQDRAPPPAPPAPLDRAGRARLKRLKRIVDAAAEELALDASLLANRRDLLALIHAGALPERLTGWRRAVIGDPLLAALGEV